MDSLRSEIRSFLGLTPTEAVSARVVRQEIREDGYTRKAISYTVSDGDTIEAFLFEPSTPTSGAAVVALHQHNSEWAIGKSEIAGLAGDPLQAFGPVLARRGLTVLAPDAVGFESRRGLPGYGGTLAPGDTRPHFTPDGWLQYYNHAMHRLVRGELLMTKHLADVESAVTVLRMHAGTDRVGLVGHSHGGNLSLFAAALDTRIAFTCSSGSACSFRHKLAHGTGIDMALAIPAFAPRFDLDDLMRLVAPRSLLIVSAENDPYSADASDLIARTEPAFLEAGSDGNLQHFRSTGHHALDAQRFGVIVEWMMAQSARLEG